MTSPNTPVDVEALEKVARAATPGEWKAFPADPGGAWGVRAVYESAEGFRTTAFPATCQAGAQPNGANATFIATFDPPTVLRLLAERREMLEALKRADGFVRRVARLSHSGDDGYTEPDDPAEDHYALDSLIAAAREIDIWPLRAILGAAILSALPEGKGE